MSEEKKKRESYETTRAYTDEEAKVLIADAFRALFVTLPAIQASALKELRALGLDFSEIQFVSPDEPGSEEFPHTLSFDLQQYSEELANERLNQFFNEIEE